MQTFFLLHVFRLIIIIILHNYLKYLKNALFCNNKQQQTIHLEIEEIAELIQWNFKIMENRASITKLKNIKNNL